MQGQELDGLIRRGVAALERTAKALDMLVALQTNPMIITSTANQEAEVTLCTCPPGQVIGTHSDECHFTTSAP